MTATNSFKVYSSVVLLCSQSYVTIITGSEHFHHHQMKPYIYQQSLIIFPQVPQPRQPLMCFLWAFHINEIILMWSLEA